MDQYRRILGVSEDATTAEIREAYREKVQEYHPDLNDGEHAEEQFKRVKEAYDALKEGPGGGSPRASEGPSAWGEVEVGKDYNTGWRLVYQDEVGGPDRRWAIVGQGGDADGVRYIDDGARAREEPFFFDEREQAERTYSEFRFRTDSDDADGRTATDVAFEREFDTLWNLYRAETDGGGTEWLVGTRVDGADHYLNADGEHQTEPHWFQDREDAADAYRTYVGAETADVGGTGPSSDETAGDPGAREPSLAAVLVAAIQERHGSVERALGLLLVAAVGYVLGAAGVGPAGSSDGGSLVGTALDLARSFDIVAFTVAVIAAVKGLVLQNDGLVLPISAFYATVAAAYLLHRFLAGRGERPDA